MSSRPPCEAQSANQAVCPSRLPSHELARRVLLVEDRHDSQRLAAVFAVLRRVGVTVASTSHWHTEIV